MAQFNAPAMAPPGTTATDVAAVAGWARYLFYFIALILFVVGVIAMMRSVEYGGGQVLGVLLGVVLCGSAGAIVLFLYHNGSG